MSSHSCIRLPVACILAIAGAIGFAPHAAAVNFQWQSPVSGDWEDVDRWTPDTAPGYPDSSSHAAQLLVVGTYTVDLNGSQTGADGPATMQFENGDVTFDLNGNDIATGTLFLGNNGNSTSTFTLTGGGQLAASDVRINQGSNSNLTLNVTGPGTNLDGVAGFMGTTGSPTLTINVTNGGSITKTSGGVSGTVLGNIAGATVNLLVDGPNSELTNSLSGISFGTAGTFTGTVRNGGRVEGVTLTMGDTSANSTLTVTDDGSTFHANTSSTIGGRSAGASTGTAALTIEKGASGFAGTQLLIGQGTSAGGPVSGTVTVKGPGSSFTVGDGTSNTNALEVGFNFNNTPVNGSLYVLDGGQVTVALSSGTGNNHARIGFQQTGSGATALVHVSGSGPTRISRLNVDGKGGLTIAQGTSTGTLEVGRFGEVNVNHATGGNIINGSSTNPNGTIRLDGGTITLPASRSLTNWGTIEGNGTISRNSGAAAFTVTNNGIIQPGLSTGTIRIVDGNLSQSSAAASILLELGYPVAGYYDRIIVSGGTISITAGTIDFLALPGKKPADGVYDLMTASTITLGGSVLTAAMNDATALASLYGGTATLQLLGAPGSGQTLQLTFMGIPEPGVFAMLLAGLTLLTRRR